MFSFEGAKMHFLYLVRVNGGEGTPVPIPNTEVKLVRGDNTWLATAREDNSARTWIGRQPVGCRPFLYEENHSLGEWFKRSLLAMWVKSV